MVLTDHSLLFDGKQHVGRPNSALLPRSPYESTHLSGTFPRNVAGRHTNNCILIAAYDVDGSGN